MIKKITSSLAILMFTLTVSAQNYCLAIRGNGELQPAHWGAMASVVERLGLPSAMAGGSSATISMFLLESMAMNPLLKNLSEAEKNQSLSLMLKSLLGFVSALNNTKTTQNIKLLYQDYQNSTTTNQLQRVSELVKEKNWKMASDIVNQALSLGFISAETLKLLTTALVEKNSEQAQFYLSELQTTIKVFGKFNALEDDNLFFRAGLIDFNQLAAGFGRVASFYAAQNLENSLNNKWTDFLALCSQNSEGLSWVEILNNKPECQVQFQELFNNYFNGVRKEVASELRPVGGFIPTFASTSIIAGLSAQQTIKAMSDYKTLKDAHFGKDFQLQNAEDLRFGYWGQEQQLKNISQKLSKEDEKSRRFIGLGVANWKTVLSYSPAEPGLSPLKEIKVKGQSLVSAGGWSDLHPSLVLKAFGCENVVYVTRQGAESSFATGVAKRLFGQKTIEVNDSPVLSKLYSLDNPNSSYVRSLKNSDAVLCTNWNSFKLTADSQNLMNLIQDSYQAQYHTSSVLNTRLLEKLGAVSNQKVIGCH
jgi:hypothetical protein